MMSVSTLLVVDDEPYIRQALATHLGMAGYESDTAEDGLDAWEILQKEPDRYDAVLLDRSMPRMGGMQLLRRIKEHDRLKHVPIIMQTAKSDREEILEGLEAGAHYYLTKPFARRTLLAIVRSAVADHAEYRSLRRETRDMLGSFALMERGIYRFRSLEQGRVLSTVLARCCSDPERVVIGLAELLTNAVEHGNLGITYQEKSRLMVDQSWATEVERRLGLAEYADKHVRIEVRREADEVVYTIEDEGDGFDWEAYLCFSPDRAFDTHGRGIAMSRTMSFDRLEYSGRGNTVAAMVREASG